MKIQEVVTTYQALQKKMEEKTWIDILHEDDIKLLEDVETMSNNLLSQVSIFIDLYHQYIDLVQSAALFSPDFAEPNDDDAKVYPTQTFDQTASTNREARRAAEKKKTPFDVVKDKK
jgi:hypothetical protein